MNENKPSIDEYKRRLNEVRTETPTADLHRIRRNYYVDEHGQVYKATSLAQVESYEKRQYVERNNEQRSQSHYVNCYHEPIKDITDKLKLNELGALIKLLPFLRFNNDGLLAKDGKPMTAVDIAKVIGKSKRQTDGILKRLIDVGVVVKDGAKRGVRYYVDERYHTIGYTIEGVTYTKLYQKETRVRAEGLSIQEAGLLYKTLPYFHYQNYFLCANPDANEKAGEKIEHLNMTQLADLIGESRETVKRGITSLMNRGIVMKISSYNTSRILVNPDVLFRAEYETEYTDTIRKQFAELERGE